MKHVTISTTILLAIISVFLFSGQQRRPVVSSQQRLPTSLTSRPSTSPQSTLPRPHTIYAATLPTEVPSSTMPPLFWLPEDIQFPEMPPGSPRTAILLGNPKAEGLYVTRTFIPKGKQIIPHTHSDSRTVVVLSGTCYYGLGEEFNEERMQALPPGSFFTESAGVPHFTWAKESDVVLQTTALGPSGTQIVPDPQPSAVPKKP